MTHINIDSTALGAASCLLKLKRIIIDGYTTDVKPASMVYGIGVHKFVDTMYKTKGDILKAKEASLDVFRRLKKEAPARQQHLADERHMFTTAYMYWNDYVAKDEGFHLLDRGDGTPMSEMTFDFRIYEDAHITVNLQGTTDGIGKIKGGCYAIRDFKSTSSWDTKGYFTQYELSRQLRIYTLALNLMARNYPDSILGQIGKTRIGSFIDAIFVKPVTADNKYARSPVYNYSAQDLLAFECMLLGFCRRLSNAIQTGFWEKEGILNGSCVGKYGHCSFWNVCTQDDEKRAEAVLAQNFIKKPFEPLRYNHE